MKTLFTFLCLLISIAAFAQSDVYWQADFEYPVFNMHKSRFVFDTSHHHNSWQIGKPQKAVFDSAYKTTNAIVTDTVNPYPVNDTSVFIVKHDKSNYGVNVFSIRFYYKLDIDAGEIAKIEVSGDSGLTWVDVMKDDTTYGFSWPLGKPRLDTSTHEWKEFHLGMLTWANNLYMSVPQTYPSEVTADTFLYRFTFISDGVQTNKDGWMMDHFIFEDWPEGIKDLQNNGLITVYPNPSGGDVRIEHTLKAGQKARIFVYNTQGQVVYSTSSLPADGQLHLSLPDGMYYLKYITDDAYAVKRLTIAH